MDERRRIQFSVWNLMLAMVPLAVAFAVVRVGIWRQWDVGLIGAVAGLGAAHAIGALLGGGRGLREAFGISLRIFFVAAMLFMLLARFLLPRVR